MDYFGELRRDYGVAACTALEFDVQEELLWMGFQNGRLSCAHQPDMVKCSSFMGHKTNVKAIVSIDLGVLSLAAKTIRMHSRGGVVRHGFANDIAPCSDDEFNCAIFNDAAMGSFSFTNFTVGSERGRLYHFNMGAPGTPPSTVSMLQGTRVIGCDRFLVCGGAEGSLSFLDPTLRSKKIEHSFEAHTGSVLDLAVKGDYLITCGLAARSVNPYDRNAPSQLVPDPLLKLFDLRMMRQVAPVPFLGGRPHGGGPPLPCLVDFLPQFGSALLAASAMGQVHVVDVAAGQSVDADGQISDMEVNPAFHQIEGDPGRQPGVLCMAVSGSGELVGWGDVGGAVMLWGERGDAVVNSYSNATVIPESAPRPLVHIVDMDAGPLASSYYFQPPDLAVAGAHHTVAPLLSDIPMWDAAKPLQPREKKGFRPQLVEHITHRAFGRTGEPLGYIPSPRLPDSMPSIPLPPNSLLFGVGHDTVFEVADPRKRKDTDTDDGVFDGMVGGRAVSLTSSGLSVTGQEIPVRYRQPRIDLSRRGLDGFDFGLYNQTDFAGLEAATEFSYVNVALQVLFFVPEIRGALMQHLQPTVVGSELGEELGFLFQMLDKAKYAPARVKSCQSSNFLRAMMQVPEAAALGLLQQDVAVNQRIESFFRFLLSHLDKLLSDANSNSGGGDRRERSMVDWLFGCTMQQTSTFPAGYSKEREARSLSVELQYPFQQLQQLQQSQQSQQSHHAGATHTFEGLLQESLTRSRKISSWCERTKTYSKEVIQRQTPKYGQLPRILAVQCGLAKTPVAAPMWHGNNEALEALGAGAAEGDVKHFVPHRFRVRQRQGQGPGTGHTDSSSNTGQDATAVKMAAKGGEREDKHDPDDGGGRDSGGDSTTVEAVADDDTIANQRHTVDGTLYELISVISMVSAARKKDRTSSFSSSSRVAKTKTKTVGKGADDKGSLGAGDGSKDGVLPKGPDDDDIATSDHLVAHVRVPPSYYLPAERLKAMVAAAARGCNAMGEDVPPVSCAGAAAAPVGKEVEAEAKTRIQAVPVPGAGAKIEAEAKAKVEAEAGTQTGKEANVAYHDYDHEHDGQQDRWLIINDFLVEHTVAVDAVAFHVDWRSPCLLLYRARDAAAVASLTAPLLPACDVPPVVFEVPSMAQVGAAHLPPHLRPPDSFTSLAAGLLPGKGDRVAIDAEFVSVQAEESHIRADGTRVVTREGRQALARVSVIACDMGAVGEGGGIGGGVTFIDDYILPTEPVVDYLTRFSGLHPGDLDPNSCTHNLVTLKNTYLKLRFLVDRGCLFVGHGLRKDFRVVNIFVPPEQIIDTLDLYHLPGMRKMSLRFLAAKMLHIQVQDGTHDSIEDARTAMLLHNKYLELSKAGRFEQALKDLYEVGRACNWKVAI